MSLISNETCDNLLDFPSGQSLKNKYAYNLSSHKIVLIYVIISKFKFF